MIYSFIRTSAEKHEVTLTKRLEDQLFWGLTQMMFVELTCAESKRIIRDHLEAAGVEKRQATAMLSTLSECMRHCDLQWWYRGYVAQLLLGENWRRIAYRYRMPLNEAARIATMIELWSPAIDDTVLRRLTKPENSQARFYSVVYEDMQHEAAKHIRRKLSFVMKSQNLGVRDLMDIIWTKTFHEFFRMEILANDADHQKRSVMSAMHCGVKNTIQRYTSAKGGRMQGRSALVKEEQKYNPDYAVKDLVQSGRSDSRLVEVCFSDCFRDDESAQYAMENMAFVDESERRDAALIVKQLMEQDLLPKQRKFLYLMTGMFDEDFSAYLLSSSLSKKDNEELFDSLLERGNVTQYVQYAAAYLQVPVRAAHSFLLRMRLLLDAQIEGGAA